MLYTNNKISNSNFRVAFNTIFSAISQITTGTALHGLRAFSGAEYAVRTILKKSNIKSLFNTSSAAASMVIIGDPMQGSNMYEAVELARLYVFGKVK